jgi:hypothetical protein
MKTLTILSLPLFLLFMPAEAQHAPHTLGWFPGIVILNNDEILNGDINYDYANDLVMCRQNDKIRTFGPQQASSFRYYNEETNILHDYEVYAFQKNDYYEQRGFFEIVLEGKVNYIRKRNRYPIYHTSEGYLSGRSFRTDPQVVAYDYFVEMNGKLVKARHFKKEVLPILIANDQRILEFIKERRLRTYDIGDQIVLLNYHNSGGTNLTLHAISMKSN